ncbi:MAG: GNAT family N-acetyltransferase [Alphaproteobacteria bacterium]|nr:GNAT family N-acetyltransferase [Alphaproteobacteria bacterium]
MTAPFIQPLTATDYDQWRPLWEENNEGLCASDVTRETWRRLIDPDSPVHGLALHANAQIAGILHYVLHPTTGQIAPVCYMQDVFIRPDHRRKGYARALIAELAHIGKQKGWARIYWLADSRNEAAQTLYKTLGIRLDFSLHVLPL